MTLQDVYDIYGKEIGNLAVKRYNEYDAEWCDSNDLSTELVDAFDWFIESEKEANFWNDICHSKPVQELKEEHPTIFKKLGIKTALQELIDYAKLVYPDDVILQKKINNLNK